MRYREILEACWSTHRQVGMKKKGDRMVPNCVAKEDQDLEEDLKKWFKEKWVRFGPDGKIRGDCARGDDSEGKPKCLPRSKAYALGKKKRAAAGAKKRREDPNPERRGAAKNVATRVRENEVKDLEKVLQNPHSYDAIDHMMQSIAKKSGITAKELHDRFVAKHNKTPDDWIKRKGKK